ncbi:hypothetical protein F5Y03DRAFT_410114 [Xylaria venustula]|nr:hypothetical protein F5Y03DRAFT_410114 [Xylaria venustula]
MASHDNFAPETEQSNFYRWARPPMQSGPQQPWYPPSYYHQYPITTFVPYQQHATQTAPAPARWGGFDLFDEEEQDRRKKGKELVPTWPGMNAPPPPWIAYPGGYGPRDYAPLGNHMWPALPLPQPTPLHPLSIPGDLEHTPRKPGKHVHHHDQLLEIGEGQKPSRRQSQSKIIRGVDGILTPSSGDLTVHLTLDLEEDLEDRLDEMNRLSRLGEFSLAKKYFQEHLHHHIDNPYVLVQYADLLLHQGEFKGVTFLKDDVMYRFEGEQPNSEELRILRVNWELLQILARSKTMESLSGAPAVFEEAVSVLAATAKDSPPDRPISSTEIEILALILQLTGHPVLNSKWLRYGARAIAAFSTTFLSLYQTLLRQGRIWDLHDLIVLLPTIEDIKALTHDIFGKDLIPSLEAMVSDWSGSIHGYDASTTLGLLSILTHILLEPVEVSEKECIDILKLCLPLAISITKNDPRSLKSRAYLRVLLAKSRFVETASRQAINTLATQLQNAQGVFYHSDIAILPIYVPSGSETPQWTVTDQHPELKDPVKLVLRSAIELDDLKTESLARQELIRLSNNPRDEFDMLCDLQLTRQRDLKGYGLSLASKYLVSSTKAAKEELSILISRLLSKVASTDYWDPSHEWILNMLLYNLEGKSPSTIKYLLERSHTDYENIDESLLREISRKIPILKDWVDQQTGSPTQTKVKNTVLRTGYGSRRSRRPATRRPSSSRAARAVEPSSTREKRSPRNEKNEVRETPLMTGVKPEGSGQDHVVLPENGVSYIHPVNDGQQTNLEHLRTSQETPGTTLSRPNDNPEYARRSPNEDELIDSPGKGGRHDEIDVATQIRKRLEAEYSKRLEAEKESEQERRKERMAILEGLKREVEAIRKEAVEQAERKARVEEHERAEQLRWERRLEESKLEKEMAMVKAEVAAAERDAKFEATRQRAIEDAEKTMKEEFEMRRMVSSLNNEVLA